MTQAQFNDLYWAAQPPEVRILRETPSDKMELAAKALAVRGYLIDGPIHGWGWDPYKIMALRQEYGLPFILAVGGQQIKTSLDPKDYPPFEPPKMSDGAPVGVWSIENLYRPGPGDSAALADGAKWEDERGKFVKHIRPLYPPNPFNPNAFSVIWEKVG